MAPLIVRGLLIVVSALFLGAPIADAQQSAAARIRGAIESVDGSLLTLKSRDGSTVEVQINDKTALIGLSKISLGDIKPNAFIGVAGLPQPDGSQKALSVHVFPEALRGTGEGFRSYDVAPNSSMTNGAIAAETVTGNSGRVLTVKYRDGEKKIVVEPSTSLVRFEPGAARAELKPGVKLVINATKRDDGTLEATRILIGREGLTPAL